MPDFAEIFKRIQEFFKKLTMVQKLIGGGIVVAVIIAIVMLGNFSTKTTYSYLYKSPLSPEDYALVTKKLDEMNVKYSLKDDKYVLVEDEATAMKTRTRLGQDGFFPSGIKGWELFDTQKFTITDFERKVNLQRAVIGEMTKHLKSLDDIHDVSIQVSFPQKQSIYSDFQTEISASVIITPVSRVNFAENKKKIKGIVDLVAAGIPDLKPENIVVVDDRGVSLSDLLVPDEMDDKTRIAKRLMKIQAREQAKIIGGIRIALQKSLPENRFIVMADIELDWTKRATVADKILPTILKEDNPLTPYDDSEYVATVKVSSKEVKEVFEGPAYIPEGAPGVDNNVPGGLKDKIDRATHYQRDENIDNNDYSKEHIVEEKAPYTVKKVSVAVSIDGIWKILRNDTGDPIITNGGHIARKYTKIPTDELKKYNDWVKGAIGFDAKRGDTVVVNNIKFDHSAEFEIEDQKIRRKIQLRRTLIASIIVLFFLFIGTLAYRAAAREMERRRRLREEELARQQQAMREAALRAAEEEAATVELSIEEKARMELLENAINVSRERPEDVSRLIRTWLAEE